MKKILLALTLLQICQYTQAQSNPETPVARSEKTLEERMAGTFQVIIEDSQNEIVFTTDILEEIEKRRDDNNEVIYQYSENISIRILPRSVINSSSFRASDYPLYVYKRKELKNEYYYPKQKNP
jgi:hypothetical protein